MIKQKGTDANVKQRLTIFFLALMISVSASQAQGLIPRLGEQRAGTAAVTFLKIGVGARGASMGGAYTAMATDASATYWNPAGLVQSVFCISRICR